MNKTLRVAHWVCNALVVCALFAMVDVLIPPTVEAQNASGFSAQIVIALNRFLASAHSWSGAQTFQNVTINGTCSGSCGGSNQPFSTLSTIGVSGSLLASTTPLNGLTTTPVGQVKFTVGASESTTRTASLFVYMPLSAASTSSKFGVYSAVEVPSSNDNTLSGSLRSYFGSVDIYGPTSHQYTGSLVGGQYTVGIHNTGGATNVFGVFVQALVDTMAGSVGILRGVYGEVDNNITSGGNVVTQLASDFEIVAGAGSHTQTSYGVYTEATGAGLIDVGYGFYNDVATATVTSKWSFYNADTVAPARSLSNWRAPFFAAEASSILTSGNTIAPTNQIHHVSGTAVVKTITVPAMCSPTCAIMLVPDGAFTTDLTGNIGLASTAVVGKTLMLTWDGTKWWPSY